MLFLYIPLGILVLYLIFSSIVAFRLFFGSCTRDPNTEEKRKKYIKGLRASGQEELADKLEKGESALSECKYEDVWQTSYDGLRLHACLIRGSDSTDLTVILVHGYRARHTYDFGLMLPHYRELNCNILLIEQRSHGESEGKYITFGVKERHDVATWASYIVRRFGTEHRIALHGVSMGASSVMAASVLQEMPCNLCGVIADCGYVSPRQIFMKVLKHDIGLPPFFISPVLYILCRLAAGFDYREADASHLLRKAKVPMLFIHGGCDTFVPTECSRINYEACSAEKELWIVEGSAHAVNHITDEPGYFAHISAFLSRL